MALQLLRVKLITLLKQMDEIFFVDGFDHFLNPKDHWLYRPGDVFVVNEAGWLIKTDEVNALLLKHENNKN